MKFLSLLAAASCAAAASLPIQHLGQRQVKALSSNFTWTSTGPLIGPKDDGRNLAGIKDPSIVEINGTYHVFASTSQLAGYNLVYFSFTDFEKAGEAEFHYLDQSAIGTGYRAAPQVFFFEPHGLWYLIYQNGNAAYSTNKNIDDPLGWTAPTNFYAARPQIINDNIGAGYWVDMWVICDDTTCHLFSSDDNGQLYRSETPIGDFPKGMSEPVIAMQGKKEDLFEAVCIHRITDDYYLLYIEAIGATGERYFRSFTSDNIVDGWEPLAATEENPFAGAANVAFQGTPWTKSISHGELIRTHLDQTLTIDPCKLRFLYQGLDPELNTGEYNALPWRLALITQTNSAC
ncbi:alpha-L-arabinofuranosidase C [Podospora aff. communis PSN243]|uniref:Alpha-L-arabinofuranosidase n=1 Tax=Podospora aff. communis PSN243 TaxID=3040156 RepID=A0AAV9GE52_9PEZI|nr:alpha-L-arabinofuranosidase C [Podospora aff. communis PSN243]